MKDKCKLNLENCEYDDYLELYLESDKSIEKLSHSTYHKYEKELIYLLTLENVQKLNKDEKERAVFLEQLLTVE
jgi:hypothetical protein